MDTHEKSLILDKLEYRAIFDELLLSFVTMSINEEIAICNEIWFSRLYPSHARISAADAGHQLGIPAIETIPIFVLFSALEFERTKTVLDKLLRRKKDFEKRHLAVHNYLVDKLGGAIEDYSAPWAEAYHFNLISDLFGHTR